jgi:hypothetical protein
MNPEDVGKILDEIGERIGPAGAYAWEITVRQVLIDGAVWSLVGLIAIVGGVVVALAGHRHDARIKERKRQDPYNYETTLDGLRYIGALPMAGIGLFLLARFGASLLNPEYYAMVRLLERLVP